MNDNRLTVFDATFLGAALVAIVIVVYWLLLWHWTVAVFAVAVIAAILSAHLSRLYRDGDE